MHTGTSDGIIAWTLSQQHIGGSVLRRCTDVLVGLHTLWQGGDEGEDACGILAIGIDGNRYDGLLSLGKGEGGSVGRVDVVVIVVTDGFA